MRLTMSLPHSYKEQKSLAILRAVYNAEPGTERRAIKKAVKAVKKLRKAAKAA